MKIELIPPIFDFIKDVKYADERKFIEVCLSKLSEKRLQRGLIKLLQK